MARSDPCSCDCGMKQVQLIVLDVLVVLDFDGCKRLPSLQRLRKRGLLKYVS